jgi:hypothetical protein
VTTLRRVIANLRDFARGFLGVTTPLPRDAAAVRRRLAEAERRPRCC